ncbi:MULTISPECIES: LLM class flavin-dependent oxidoreductase [unclassified Micromonospora]|uniref:LLM class flavin-dependent oxidoreductase n=1 Tax=unclassified Micromonospora TaxID=2617518 RepID=UPI001C237378|nr:MULTISPECIES: LLM class flavin-dependent oxidoreductase [unclassified Micromonospora]MBU8860433.1 LLM class flavin-dependent oxidoreductase [Micromonospora sp. WMMB482]MDM4779970.1 LLM class flavin-dependent oxidoreductase [Micromonospora sp. b486]
MTLHLHWFLPSHSDGRDIGWRPGGAGARRAVRREPDLAYLAQVALAAERLGFEGMLIPVGMFCEDPWLVSAALAGRTERIRFMIALRPGLMSPTLVAQMVATFQRLSGDRLMLNVVVGGDPDEQRRYGDWLDHGQRYERADEFLTILRGAWTGTPVDFEGTHHRVRAALVTRPPRTAPTVFVGGSSAGAQDTALRHGDVYLAWGESPPELGALLGEVRERGGGRLSCGTRFHVITRDTPEQAWAEADRLIAGMDPKTVAAAQERFRRSESEGQRRMARMSAGAEGRLEVYPNVWAGYGLLRPGAGAALVGSHEQVADRIAELHGLGVEHLLLSGQPHLEEAYWFGEGVLPLLRERGILAEAHG